MFYFYLPQQLAMNNAQMLAQMCSMWAQGWTQMAESLGQFNSRQADAWMGSVHRPRAWAPAVQNCAAGVYSGWGLNLAQLTAANGADYNEGRQKA